MEKKIAACAPFGALLDAVDEERSRVARQLHDRVAQNLAVISMHLAIINKSVPESKPSEAIRECSILMDETIRDVRAISYSLEPPLVAELGLTASLKVFADAFSAKSGVELKLDLDMPSERALGAQLHPAVFRMIRDSAEGLASSGAACVQVAMASTVGGVVITISGRCPPARPAIVKKLFWSVVQERAARYHGKPRLVAGELATEIQIMLPSEKAQWAVAH